MNSIEIALQRLLPPFIMVLLMVVALPTVASSAMAVAFAQDDAKWIEVEAEGRGGKAKEARKAAMLAALRKIAGEFLDQTTVMENDQITDDTLLAFTTQKAFESEDLEGFPTIEDDGTWYVKMKIRVIARDFEQLIDRFRPRTVTGQVTVEAEGIGESAAAAERDAIANGIRQIIGEHIESEIKITNERVVIDLIKSYTTSKNVTSERIGSFRAVGDEVALTMRVTAELEPLYSMFEERSTSATAIDGDVLAAELDLARDNLVAQRQILEKLLKELPTRLLIARLIDREGNPIENGRPSADDMKPILDSDEVAIALNVECYFDLPTFYSRVAPSLARALDAMATDRKTMSIEAKEGRGFKCLFTMQPAIWNYEHNSWTYNSNTPPDKCQVILPRQRNANGSRLGADLYILPKDLFPAFNNVVGSFDRNARQLFPIVFIDLLDQDGETIKSMEWNPAYLWKHSNRTPRGKDLPIFADFNGLNEYPCFNMSWYQNGVNTVMINPCFAGNGIFDTSVWRHEFRMSESDFEKLDRVALSAQLYETSYGFYPDSKRDDDSREREKWRTLNTDLDPIVLGWKDAQGNPIEPGGAFDRSNRPNRTRANRGSSSDTSGSRTKSSSNQAPTINQKEPQEQAGLKQFNELISGLGMWAMNGLCDKALSTAEELLLMNQELMSEDRLWLAITNTAKCPHAEKKLLEKLVELYPDRPRTKRAKIMLHGP